MAEAGEVERVPAIVRRLVAELEAADDGVSDEIAAARYILGRVLEEVEDPVRQARALADAAGVVGQLRRLERVMSGEAMDSLAAAATRILEELGESAGGQ